LGNSSFGEATCVDRAAYLKGGGSSSRNTLFEVGFINFERDPLRARFFWVKNILRNLLERKRGPKLPKKERDFPPW